MSDIEDRASLIAWARNSSGPGSNGINEMADALEQSERELATAKAVALSAEATTREYRSEIINLRKLCGDAADALEPFIFPVREPDPRDYR